MCCWNTSSYLSSHLKFCLCCGLSVRWGLGDWAGGRGTSIPEGTHQTEHGHESCQDCQGRPNHWHSYSTVGLHVHYQRGFAQLVSEQRLFVVNAAPCEITQVMEITADYRTGFTDKMCIRDIACEISCSPTLQLPEHCRKQSYGFHEYRHNLWFYTCIYSVFLAESRWVSLPSSYDAECPGQRATGGETGPTGGWNGLNPHGP